MAWLASYAMVVISLIHLFFTHVYTSQCVWEKGVITRIPPWRSALIRLSPRSDTKFGIHSNGWKQVRCTSPCWDMSQGEFCLHVLFVPSRRHENRTHCMPGIYISPYEFVYLTRFHPSEWAGVNVLFRARKRGLSGLQPTLLWKIGETHDSRLQWRAWVWINKNGFTNIWN